MSEEPEIIKCTCGPEGCCHLGCPCFKKGGICSHNCTCENCRNRSLTGQERIEAIEQCLAENSTCFTSSDALNQEEYSSISNFAMLSTSIDSEPFPTNAKTSPLKITQEITKLAVKTIICAATSKLRNKNSIDTSNLEEYTENCIASEFEIVLSAVLKAVAKTE